MTENYYTVIPAEVRLSHSVSEGAKLLYADIWSVTKLRGRCYKSNDSFALTYNVDKRTVQRWVKELKDSNFINCFEEKKDKNNTLRTLIPLIDIPKSSALFIIDNGQKCHGGIGKYLPMRQKCHGSDDKNVTQIKTYNNTLDISNDISIESPNTSSSCKQSLPVQSTDNATDINNSISDEIALELLNILASRFSKVLADNVSDDNIILGNDDENDKLKFNVIDNPRNSTLDNYAYQDLVISEDMNDKSYIRANMYNSLLSDDECKHLYKMIAKRLELTLLDNTDGELAVLNGKLDELNDCIDSSLSLVNKNNSACKANIDTQTYIGLEEKERKSSAEKKESALPVAPENTLEKHEDCSGCIDNEKLDNLPSSSEKTFRNDVFEGMGLIAGTEYKPDHKAPRKKPSKPRCSKPKKDPFAEGKTEEELSGCSRKFQVLYHYVTNLRELKSEGHDIYAAIPSGQVVKYYKVIETILNNGESVEDINAVLDYARTLEDKITAGYPLNFILGGGSYGYLKNQMNKNKVASKVEEYDDHLYFD